MMKKHILLALSALFLLGGCDGLANYLPQKGGTYDPTQEVPEEPTLVSLGVVSVQDAIYQDETLKTEDVSVLAVYSDESIKSVHPDSIELDTSSVGEQQGTLNVGDLTATFNIVVLAKQEDIEEKTVASLGEIVTKPSSIRVFEVISLNDVELVVYYSDGTNETVHPTSIKLDNTEAGTKTATIGYGGKFTTFDVVILENGRVSVTGLGNVEAPSTIEIGQTLSPSSVFVTVNYSDGTNGKVNPTSIDLDTSTAGTVQGTVHYLEFDKTFEIEVVEHQEKVATGLGRVYLLVGTIYEGDVLTTSQIAVDLNWSDGTTTQVTPESISVDTSTAGTFEGTLSYQTFNTTFTYTVVKYEEEEEEEDVLMCTYNIYFSYSQTTTAGAKKDVDDPLISFQAPMLSPLGKAPEAIRSALDDTKVDAIKFRDLGESKGYTVDKAFPTFIGLSFHALCLDDNDLWDFKTDWKQMAVVTLYGIWVSE